MRERRRKGVQAVPSLVLDGEGSVESVVHDVHAGECELRTDLVGDARVDRDFEERPLFVLDHRVADGLELRDGMEALRPSKLGRTQSVVMRVNHPAEGQCRVVYQVVLKRSANGDRPLDKREVGLPDGLGAELRAQAVERLCRAGDKHEPGRVGVDAMERSGHQGRVAKRSAFGITVNDRVHQRAGLSAGKRLHGHSRRLVEGENRVVFEGDAQGTGNRLDEIVRGFQQPLDDNGLSAAQFLPLGNAARRSMCRRQQDVA